VKVAVFGAGKAGRSLARALRAGGVSTTLRAQRRGLVRFRADLLVLAVRDEQIQGVAEELARRRLVAPPAAVVHCAGALGVEVLAPLGTIGVAIGHLHPLVALADARTSLAGGFAHVAGDRAAVRLASAAARAAGLAPFGGQALDLRLYHASAALLANGAAALAGAAATAFVAAGGDPELAPKALGALLASVAENVARLGLPEALTGPVRRGSAKALALHLAALGERTPELVPLYRALARAQLPMARTLGEAEACNFDAVERLLR
jgi:predicted short-subunit dehydrogenase-like oxidoreductase (DUF2520 family)